jgi:UDP-GlcNAc:undecaprenyl-phosphate GlcNAc-1-phosphate transferase
MFETEFISSAIFTFALAFGITAGLVAVTIRVCQKQGWVAEPRHDRWHNGRPSFYGGVPVWLGFITLGLFFLPFANHLIWKLIGASTLMFLLGLADDVFHLQPRIKFAAQILAAALVVYGGVVYPLFQSQFLNIVISILWIVGITNAFNLLDNMDGLSAGVAVISAAYLSIFYAGSGSTEYATLVILGAGVASGFLWFNFNPARIFMGDSGSLFLGFLLGSTSLLGVTHVAGVPLFVFAPAMILAIPVFDTFFVSVTRRLRGQAISQGGTDHSSHRLVRLGLNERNAVLLLYALSIGSGAVGLAVRHIFYARAIGLVGFWFLFLLLFGIHLFQATPATATPEAHTTSTFFKRFLERDTLVFLLDPVVLSLSYYLAYFLRFKTYVPRTEMDLFFRSWPIVLAVKFFCMALCRVYKSSWWRGSVRDLYRLAEATLIGEVLSILVLIGLYRFQGFSRVVFFLDGLFTWLLLVAVRKSFTLFLDSFGTWGEASSERRVFVLGTSEKAEVALRFLRGRRIACAGLIDTNGGSDVGRWVWGSRVLGSLNDLTQLGNRHGVSEVVLPEDESVPYSDIEFYEFCRRAHVRLIKLGLYPAQSGT